MAKKTTRRTICNSICRCNIFQCETRWNSSKEVYIALGVIMTVEKEILVFYNIGDSESVKYWTSILNDIKNRGVKDILIMCSDGLKEAISTVSISINRISTLYCTYDIRNTHTICII